MPSNIELEKLIVQNQKLRRKLILLPRFRKVTKHFCIQTEIDKKPCLKQCEGCSKI